MVKHIDWDPRRTKEKMELSKLLGSIIYIGPNRGLGNGTTGGGNHYDAAVGTNFVSSWNTLKNGPRAADGQIAQIAESKIADLVERPGLTINADDESKKLYLSAPSRPRLSISELGSGIAELVLCVVTAAIKKPSWILIDEPEAHVHPALQTKFVAALESLASCGVVFTTHSIGLARSCASTILTVRQDEAGVSHVRQLEDTPNYAQLMGELSFSQHHALGYNTLLLCEGVTEIKTLQQLLRKWKMDNKIMLIPLGGNTYMKGNREAELNEFKRFGVPVYVLVDSESKASDQPDRDRQAFGNTCCKLFDAEHVLLTERRAMEHYLTTEAIQKAKKSVKYTALSPYEDFKSKQPSWNKNENWKIAAEMSHDEWASTDVGRFLNRLLDPKPNNPAT